MGANEKEEAEAEYENGRSIMLNEITSPSQRQDPVCQWIDYDRTKISVVAVSATRANVERASERISPRP